MQNYVEAPSGSFVRVEKPERKSFYQCLFLNCKGEGQTLRDISRHYDLDHADSRLSCPISGCETTLADQSYLELHMAVEHEGKRPFQCPKDGCKWAGKYEEHLKSSPQGGPS